MNEWERAGRAYDDAIDAARAREMAEQQAREAAAAAQRRSAEQIDAYVQDFVKAMAGAGNPGSDRRFIGVRRSWPFSGYREVEYGRQWQWRVGHTSFTVHTDGTWRYDSPSNGDDDPGAYVVRSADGLTRVNGTLSPKTILEVLTRLLRMNRIPLPH